VGVPKPVVNSTILAPAPTSAVVLSTSLPGVQSRFSPGLEHNGRLIPAQRRRVREIQTK
jgi:hypothetical protein